MYKIMEMFMYVAVDLATYHEVRRAKYINQCRKVVFENKC